MFEKLKRLLQEINATSEYKSRKEMLTKEGETIIFDGKKNLAKPNEPKQ